MKLNTSVERIIEIIAQIIPFILNFTIINFFSWDIFI